ncbi:MAG: hypothetical protein Q9213_007563 [Squamulea squamosa]
MHLLTLLLSTITLFDLTAASTFHLINKKHTLATGCDLKLTDICGCTKAVAISNWLDCGTLTTEAHRGNVCGGKWAYNSQDPKHTVTFEKPGCKMACDLNSELGEEGKQKGALCDAMNY